jgi:hypothetical protein
VGDGNKRVVAEKALSSLGFLSNSLPDGTGNLETRTGNYWGLKQGIFLEQKGNRY